MTAADIATWFGGVLVFLLVMIAVMATINQRERRTIDRLRAEWRARGSIPEEEPKFGSYGLS